jgi:cell wall-associated NlpC family hydrolase
MTFVERPARLATVHAVVGRGFRRLLAVLAVVAMCLGTVEPLATSAGAATVAQEKAQAAYLYSQVQKNNYQAQVLGQKFNLAHMRLTDILNSIRNTRATVRTIEANVSKGREQLKSAAVFAFVTHRSVNASNPLFGTSATTAGATTIYNTLAEGDVGSTIARLTNNRVALTLEKTKLRDEVQAARHQADVAKAALFRANHLVGRLNTNLAAVRGKIASYYAAIAAAAAAKARAALAAATSNVNTTTSAPGPNPAANIAIKAAESFLGTWYCWGGASRSCVDCSGLIMLAYDAAGIYLPHYSGAQFDATQRVPLWDIQPGDLLFYGYNGDEHVAMYVGHGDMIEAPQTGYQVHITPVRLGYGFAGVGRPRA